MFSENTRGGPMKDFIKTIMEKEKENVISLRRELHKHPELSKEEEQTTEFIEDYLKNIGYAPKRVTKTGVIAYLDCGFSDTTLLRADIDALPVTEKNNADYKSKQDGVMHACGHDAHMAILLISAKVLWENKDKLKTNVLFVFQPDEETDGGAKPMIDAGIIKDYNVTTALGYHVTNDVPVGKVMIKSGALMASPDDFSIKITGRGGHGALPEKCIDPLLTASKIVPELNAVTNMTIKENERQVVQVCQIHGGTFCNAIPEECIISGTARSFNEEVRNEIPKIMEKIINEEAEKTGAKAEFTFNYSYPPLINNERVTEQVKKAVEKHIGDVVITWSEGQMTGEDFAYFAKEVPSLFMFLGTGNEEKGITMPLHSENFEIDEAELILGVGIYLAFLAE